MRNEISLLIILHVRTLTIRLLKPWESIMITNVNIGFSYFPFHVIMAVTNSWEIMESISLSIIMLANKFLSFCSWYIIIIIHVRHGGHVC